MSMVLIACAPAAATERLAPGFQDVHVLGTAERPIPQAVIARFAPDGEVFVAGQNGYLWEFSNVASRTAHLVADLSGDSRGTKEVMDWENRGLLGLAVDPAYPVRPYIYLLYTYDAPPGRKAPVWPFDAAIHGNTCPTPPGPALPNDLNDPVPTTGDGCIVSGRLSRITINVRTHRMIPGTEVPLIKDDWCDQSLTHSVGDLAFAPDGSLYVSGGSGGIWGLVDYGQIGGSAGDPYTPANACGDPTADSGPGPGRPGDPLQPAPADSPGGVSAAEGGMFRSQSFRRPLDQPATLDGTIARVDPASGGPLPDNPNHSMADIDRRRIVAYGLRQPFRFVIGPAGKSQLWIGDVGEKTVEEVDRDPSPRRAPSLNFGWPCYEGGIKGPAYRGISYYSNFQLCAPTVHASRLAFPYYSYQHYQPLYPGDKCLLSPGASITGLAFADAESPYPARFDGALFLADFTRQCIWTLLPDEPGALPDPDRPAPVALDDGNGGSLKVSATDLEIGPDHAIYYVNRATSTVHRLGFATYPTSVLNADIVYGRAPLTVHFSGTSSSSPDPGPTFSWTFGDSSAARTGGTRASHKYNRPGLYTATLTVLDRDGHRDTSSIRIAVGPVLSGVRATGSLLRFTLLESADVQVTIEQAQRRQGRTYFRPIAIETFAVSAGNDRERLTAASGSNQNLAPGSYRAIVRSFYGRERIAEPAVVSFQVRGRRFHTRSLGG